MLQTEFPGQIFMKITITLMRKLDYYKTEMNDDVSVMIYLYLEEIA